MNMVWMIYVGHMIPEDECSLNFLTFILQFRENPGKILNREIDPTGDRVRARCVRNNDVTPRPQRWSPMFTILSPKRIINKRMFSSILPTVYYTDTLPTCTVVCPSGAWFENIPHSTPSIRPVRNPKRVIVQWVGIGTHMFSSINITSFCWSLNFLSI